MEEKLLELFKLANKLNDTQDKVYAEIKYSANDSKTLEICIRTKNDFSYIEKCQIQLKNKSIISLSNFISLLETYIGGVCNE